MWTSRSRPIAVLFALVIGGSLVAEAAWAATKLWKDPASGNWSDGAKWDPAGAPAAGDSVRIVLAGTYTVTLDLNATVASLSLGAATGTQTLSMGSGRALTLNAGSTVEPGGVLDVTSAAINLPVGGSLLTDRGLLRCQGNCTLGGSGALYVAPGATVRMQGSGSGGGTLTVANGFVNEGLIELTNVLAGQAATLNVTAGTLTNAAGGQIRVLAGTGTANRTLGAELNNLGTLEVALGASSTFTLSKASAHHSNGSLIDMNGGNFTVSQSGTGPSFANSGTIDGTGGGEVTFSGGTFNNTGALSVASGQALTLQSNVFNNLSGGTFGGSGSVLQLSSSTMNATPDYSTAGTTVAISNSTWNGPGTFTNASTTVTLVLTSSAINAPFVQPGGATLVCQGSCALGGAFGPNPSGSVIRMQGSGAGSGTLTVANGFVNEGLIELTNTYAGQAATLNVTAGTLTNAAGGQIRVLAGTGTANRTLGAELNNLGTLEVALGASSTFTLSKASAHHSNGSLIDMNGGNFTVSQSGTGPSFANSGTIDGTGGGEVTFSGGTFNNTGALSVASGQTLTLQSNVFNNLSGGTFGGSGSVLQLSSSTMNATPDYSTAGTTVAISNSTWNGPGTFTNASTTVTLVLTSSAINAPFVQPGGATLVCQGSCALGGAFGPNPSGSVIRMQGSGAGSGTLTVANGFVNEGLIELTNTYAGQAATLNVTAGTLTNAAGGQIRVLAGLGTANRTLGAELNNLGTLEVALGASSTFTLSKASAHHSNGSLIDMNGGNFTVSQSGTGPSFANSGTIDGTGGGEVTISGGTFNNTGALSVASGQTLTLQSNVFNNLSGGTFGGSGSVLQLSSSTMNATPDYSTAGTTVAISNSTWNGPGTFTNASTTVALNLTSSAINAPFVQPGGATLVCQGSCALGGAFGPNPSGSVIRMQGSGSGGGTLTVANGFVNEGLIELTNTYAGQPATLNVTAGTLTNAAGGQIRALAGVGTANRTLGAELNNLGTLEVALGASSTFTLSKGSADHMNSGQITLTGGDFLLSQTGTTPTLTNTGTIHVGSSLNFTISGGALTNFSGSALNGGTYEIAGTFKFPGADIATNGATIVLDGSVSTIQNSAGVNALANFSTNASTGSFTIENGRNLSTGAFTNAGQVGIGPGSSTWSVTGAYSQSGGYTRLDSGVLAATGPVNIAVGSLIGSGTVGGSLVNAGLVSPGASAGAIHVTGNYTQSAAGVLRIELGGTDPGTGYDALTVNGTASLDGTLQPSLIDSFIPPASTVFDILTASSVQGVFAEDGLPLEGSGRCLSGNYLPDRFQILTSTSVDFIEQPQSRVVCEGSPVTFTARMSVSEGITFQWRKDGHDIVGATNDSLTIQAVHPTDAGTYDVVCMTPCGLLASDPATLTVYTPVNITTEPQPQAVCPGQPVEFSVVAQGAPPPSYQWRKNGQPIEGAVESVYAIQSAGEADAGSYDVIARNDCGADTSMAVVLTVKTLTAITQQPHSRSACIGDSVRFSVRAVGTNLTFQWRRGAHAIGGATDTTFAIASVSQGDQGNYDVLIGGECGADTSDVAVLSVPYCSGGAGVCCLPDGSCQILRATECYALSGIYGGDNSSCDQIPCDNPAGVENPAEPSEAARIPTVLIFAGISRMGGSAAFELGLPYPAEVRLTLFDIAGRFVVCLQDGMLPAGMHEYPIASTLSGRLSNGIYFGRAEIQSKEFNGIRTGRIRLLR